VTDRDPLSAIQWRVLLLLVLAYVLEGFDLQVVAFASPSIVAEWGISKQSLGPAMAASLVGMIIGSALGGRLGDRIGRRPTVVASIAIFSGATLLTAWAGSVDQIAVLRLVAGLGFGAALTSAMALLAEWLPTRIRSRVVSVVVVSVPGGGMLGAALCAWLIPAAGWRAAFVAGGALPGVLALLQLLHLPESPGFLSLREAGPGQRTNRAALRQLLSAPYIKTTVGLAIAFFSNLAASYAFFSWIPLLVSALRYPAAAGIRGSFFFNLFGAVGVLVGARTFARWNPTRGLFVFVAVGLFSMLALALSLRGLTTVTAPTSADLVLLMTLLSLAGVGVVGVQAGLYGLASSVYPTWCRATGVGVAGSFGRVGAILSAYGGGAILSLASGVHVFLVIAALLFVVSGVGIWLVGSPSEPLPVAPRAC
jgi:MFS transporter, AAHS family, 4-hydroxybenzoate transporter